MSKRVPASMRTRQSLSDVIEGRLIIEETLEAEARDAVGRDGAEPGSGYRNRYYVGCMTRTRRFLGAAGARRL